MQTLPTTSDRSTQLKRLDLLVQGFIRSITLVPDDILTSVKSFTPIFKPHHLVLFDSTLTKQLKISFDQKLLPIGQLEIVSHSIHSLEGENRGVLYITEESDDQMCIVLRTWDDPSMKFQSKLCRRFNGIMDDEDFVFLRFANNDHLDFICEHYPNQIFRRYFRLDCSKKTLDWDQLVLEKEKITNWLCQKIYEPKFQVQFQNEFLCEMNAEFSLELALRMDEYSLILMRLERKGEEPISFSASWEEGPPTTDFLYIIQRLLLLFDEVGTVEEAMEELDETGFICGGCGWHVTEEMVDELFEVLEESYAAVELDIEASAHAVRD